MAKHFTCYLGTFKQRCTNLEIFTIGNHQHFIEVNIATGGDFQLFEAQVFAFLHPVLFATTLYNCVHNMLRIRSCQFEACRNDFLKAGFARGGILRETPCYRKGIFHCIGDPSTGNLTVTEALSRMRRAYRTSPACIGCLHLLLLARVTACCHSIR